MKIVRYKCSSDIDVQFLDEFGYIKEHTTYTNFKKGQIKNPYDKTVYGVGYIGVGDYSPNVDGKTTVVYMEWYDMIKRCYSDKYKDKFPAYYHICTVCDEWLCYQNFAKWYSNNQYECKGRLHIDKDIIVSGNKVYGSETCILVPQRINMLFTNKPNKRGLPNGISKTMDGYEAKYAGKVIGMYNSIEEAYNSYSIEKEKAIKNIAEEYKDIIPSKLYNALCSYKVDINIDKNYQMVS